MSVARGRGTRPDGVLWGINFIEFTHTLQVAERLAGCRTDGGAIYIYQVCECGVTLTYLGTSLYLTLLDLILVTSTIYFLLYPNKVGKI